MSEGILSVLITGGFSFAGVLVTSLIANYSSNKKVISEIKSQNAEAINEIKEENNKVVNEIKLELTEYKATTNEQIKELTREVREHNNFAKRMPVVEKGIENLEEKVNFFHKV